MIHLVTHVEKKKYVVKTNANVKTNVNVKVNANVEMNVAVVVRLKSHTLGVRILFARIVPLVAQMIMVTKIIGTI